jgi:dihydrolipoamide dehydrogenase
MSIIDVKVPDIGDFSDVPIIDIFVKVGDVIALDDPLITLESDKASLEIPSPVSGKITELKIKVGDRVSQDSVILSVESDIAPVQSPSSPVMSPPSDLSTTKDVVTSKGESPLINSNADYTCDLVVLGAGPGGYSAAFRAADLGMKVILIERYPTLGGVCLNVGCIPSKSLLHLAEVLEEASNFSHVGIEFSSPKISLDKIRHHKESVVSKLTGGLVGMAKARKVEVVRGLGSFIDAHHIEVLETTGEGQEKTGQKKIVHFTKAIIAAGSRPVHLPFLPKDDRIVDSTGALKLNFIPKKMLVIGGGIIGLEMATVYSALGAKVDVVEMLDGLMQGPDRDLVKVWDKQNKNRFDKVMIKTKTIVVEARKDGLWVSFEGENAPQDKQCYDLILQSVGRIPNGLTIGAEKAAIQTDQKGFIPVNSQMKTNIDHIYAIGDIVGQPMLAHKAVHEAHVAAESAFGLKSHFDAKVIPGVAYTHPEVAWVGIGEDDAKREGRKIESAKFPWAASGRAIANGAEYGFTKVIFDSETRRIIGGGIVGPNAGDMIGEIALAIEMGCDAIDIGKTIHPHPTLGETIGLASELAHGSCTDLPPVKKASHSHSLE